LGGNCPSPGMIYKNASCIVSFMLTTGIPRLLSETGRFSNSPIFVVGVYSGADKLGEGFGASLKMAEYRVSVSPSFFCLTVTDLVKIPTTRQPRMLSTVSILRAHLTSCSNCQRRHSLLTLLELRRVVSYQGKAKKGSIQRRNLVLIQRCFTTVRTAVGGVGSFR